MRGISCSKLPTDGYAQHPYAEAPGPFWTPPTDDVTIGTIGRLVTALDRAAAAGAIRSGLPVYITEFGVQSVPNPTQGVPVAKQAEFDAISERIAWSNPRVVSFDQYLLRDDPPVKSSNPILRWPGFESGLETYKGTTKPSYGGFRLPLVVTRTHAGVSLWGLVRPASVPASTSTGPTGSTGSTGSTGGPASTGTRLEVQYSSNGGKTWRNLQSVHTDASGAWSASGHFALHRMWRTKWVSPGGATFTGAPTRAYTTSGRIDY